MSDSLRPHELQHTKLPCPSLPPRVCSKFLSMESVIPSNHLILCHPLLLPSVFPSIKVFPSESALYIRWLKYCSFSFRISLSSEYAGLLSFRSVGGTSGKEPDCLCKRHKRCRFDPWVWKIPWKRKWQPSPVFLPGKSHGQSLVGHSPWGQNESDVTEAT